MIRTLIILAVLTSSLSLLAQQPANVAIVAHILKPAPAPFTPDKLKQLRVPAGFRVTAFATDVGKPRILAVAADGSVYATRRDPGDIILLRDTNGDGAADTRRVVVRRPQLHGIALHGQRAYFIGVNDLFVADVTTDGSFTNTTRLVDDLPDGGQHADRTLRVGPDGQLYISVGSTCNACDETNPENATLLRAPLDASSRTIFASGLRNTIGFDWHPETKQLYGMDHGIDWLGDDEQIEEMNRIEQGKQYGWPYIYGHNGKNPQDEPPGEISHDEWAKLSSTPVLGYRAHSAPMQMQFYTGAQFPAEYRGDAFVAMHGSWNRKVPTGYEVVRIRFKAGVPVAIEPFLTGFLSNGATPTMFGRPFGVAVANDGALLVGDDLNGVIYRVEYGK
jgi:glucose/arabinose dehydrogenase